MVIPLKEVTGTKVAQKRLSEANLIGDDENAQKPKLIWPQLLNNIQTDKKKPGANPEPKPPKKQSKHRDD